MVSAWRLGSCDDRVPRGVAVAYAAHLRWGQYCVSSATSAVLVASGIRGHSGNSWIVGLRGCKQQVGVALWSLGGGGRQASQGCVEVVLDQTSRGLGERGCGEVRRKQSSGDRGGLIYCPVMLSRYSAFRQLLPTLEHCTGGAVIFAAS